MHLRLVFCKLNQVQPPQIQAKWTPGGANNRENGASDPNQFEEQRKQFSHHEEQFQQQQMQFDYTQENKTTNQIHSNSVR